MSSTITSNGDPWTDNINRSCPVLYFHFFWGISMVILGWTTLAARFLPRIKPYHRTMGQVWMYGMIIQLYSSTYARRDGFRWFIFMFGVICYVGLIVGHTFIRKFQREIPKFRSLNGERVPNNTHKGKLDTPILVTDNPADINLDTMDNNNNNNNNSSAGIDNLYDKYVDLNVIVSTVKITMGILKKLHAISMITSLIMVTGAGAAFTIRYLDVADCTNSYSTV